MNRSHGAFLQSIIIIYKKKKKKKKKTIKTADRRAWQRSLLHLSQLGFKDFHPHFAIFYQPRALHKRGTCNRASTTTYKITHLIKIRVWSFQWVLQRDVLQFPIIVFLLSDFHVEIHSTKVQTNWLQVYQLLPRDFMNVF